MVALPRIPILVAFVNSIVPFALIPRADTAIFDTYQIWYFIFGRYYLGHGEGGPISFLLPLGIGSFFLPEIEIVVSIATLGLGLFLAQLLRPTQMEKHSIRTVCSMIAAIAILQILIPFMVMFLFSGPWDYWYDVIIPLPVASLVTMSFLLWMLRIPMNEAHLRDWEGV